MRFKQAKKELENGRVLISETGERGALSWYISGKEVSHVTAKKLIEKLELVDSGDSLFPGIPAQSYRLSAGKDAT